MTATRILLFGASGSAGGGVLRACLEAPEVVEIRLITRRALEVVDGSRDGRVRQFLHADFEHYEPVREAFVGVDACFYCLGISATQVSSEAEYRRITRDFALAAATALRAGSPAAPFLFISGQGAHLQSRMMWARVKAETEEALRAQFGAICLRPAAIDGERTVTAAPMLRIARVFFPLLRPFRDLYVTGVDIGRAMLRAADEVPRGSILENREIRDLASGARKAR